MKFFLEGLLWEFDLCYLQTGIPAGFKAILNIARADPAAIVRR